MNESHVLQRLPADDRSELGARIRAARLARGLTQAQLGGEHASVAYVSRIEAGTRRPNAELLQRFAHALGLDPAELLGQQAVVVDPDSLPLALHRAEFALEAGRHDEVDAYLDEVLGEARATPAQLAQAHYLHARNREARGDLDGAIAELQRLVPVGETDPLWVTSRMALSRCHREAGNLMAAVDCGLPVLSVLDEHGLIGSDEAVQLTVTVAAAYFERGDRAEAVRLCRKAMDAAEFSGSHTAKAYAYWNASMMESAKGATSTAVKLARRAPALLGEGSDVRNLGRLRIQLGSMLLEEDTPDLDAAEDLLNRAAEELARSSASLVDRARNRLALAKALLLRGDELSAHARAGEVLDEVEGTAPLIAAEACVVQGRAEVAHGDLEAAAGCYRKAVLHLAAAGADRGVADLWFELGSLWEDVGDTGASRDAYRSAAAATGLRGAQTSMRLPVTNTAGG